jgi:hypothetical protein
MIWVHLMPGQTAPRYVDLLIFYYLHYNHCSESLKYIELFSIYFIEAKEIYTF